MGLTSAVAEQRGDKLRAVAVAPAFQPYSLSVQPRPLFFRLHRVGIDMEVGPYQGAPLGEGVLGVILRQGVRLYKFFSELMQALSIAPSCFCTAMNSRASLRS